MLEEIHEREREKKDGGHKNHQEIEVKKQNHSFWRKEEIPLQNGLAVDPLGLRKSLFRSSCIRTSNPHGCIVVILVFLGFRDSAHSHLYTRIQTEKQRSLSVEEEEDEEERSSSERERKISLCRYWNLKEGWLGQKAWERFLYATIFTGRTDTYKYALGFQKKFRTLEMDGGDWFVYPNGYLPPLSIFGSF